MLTIKVEFVGNFITLFALFVFNLIDYINGLKEMIEFKKNYPVKELILHSDQGAVYASKSYNELLPMYNITRSMSRAGTPTDNAAMESINGWIKAEIFILWMVSE